MKKLLLILLLHFSTLAYAGVTPNILVGAEQINLYLPMLKNKKVGVFVNQTSLIGNTPLVDILLKHGIHVKKIFVPEHGFRGDADTTIQNSVDKNTGLPIISLYGKKLKPTKKDLRDVDILLFDIQDVGVRFYTFISSLQKFMEAALENDKPLIILDRPNPNGFYVDGPVLELKFKSFTGMQPVPFVYGMTEGEYAKMLVGQEWLDIKPKSKARKLKLTVIPCVNYTHKSLYHLPVRPSPNLPEMQSIYWYASLGFLEDTVLSVGRGTNKPFQYYGHPAYALPFTFVPTANAITPYPPYKNRVCHGWNLSGSKKAVLKKIDNKLQLNFLLQAYKLFPNKRNFFDTSFDYAVGTNTLAKQIKSGLSENAIRKSWQPKLTAFKAIRKKYLLYPDFE